jgi:hypothetical protein
MLQLTLHRKTTKIANANCQIGLIDDEETGSYQFYYLPLRHN